MDTQGHFKVEELWNWLELDCGLSGVQATPLPHFSWMGMDDCDMDTVLNAMDEIASEQMAFRAIAAGVGLFTGRSPVMYLPIANNLTMIQCHVKLWQKIFPLTQNPNLYYAPGQWLPHITLAYRDIDVVGLGCAIQGLMHRTLELDLVVDNFALAYYSETDTGIVRKFIFSDNKGLL